jgi:cell fate (sporulation/competence/biofilm development) regulator YmcA (YheA/YmcA/DUF963 family)
MYTIKKRLVFGSGKQMNQMHGMKKYESLAEATQALDEMKLYSNQEASIIKVETNEEVFYKKGKLKLRV